MTTTSMAAQAVIDKVAALAPTAAPDQLAYIAKALEAVSGPGVVADVLAAGDTAVQAVAEALAQPHAHAISSVTGLQAALDGKAAAATVLTQGKHTIWVPATAMMPRNTSGASAGSAESSTNKLMRKTLDFDTATTEYAQFAIAMPKSWNEGAVTFQALWTAASGSGGVAFALQAVAVSDQDNLDAAFGTAQTVTDTLGTASYLHQTGESAAVTIAGAPAEGDMVAFQLYRDVANAADTLAADAQLLGVRMFYTINGGNDA